MKKWLDFVFCFVRRLAGAILVFFTIVAVISTTLWCLDCFKVARPNLESFAPYSSSWLFVCVLVIVSLTLILCIPGGPTAFMSLLRRVKSVGPIELFPADDPDEDDILSNAMQEILHEAPPSQISPKLQVSLRNTMKRWNPQQRKAFQERLEELRKRKKQILRLHAGLTGASVVKRRVRIGADDLFFDAYLRLGDDQILVHLVSASSTEAPKIALRVKEIVETTDMALQLAHHLFIHLVFYSTAEQTFRGPDIELVRKILFNVCNIRLYFYSITRDFAVKPLEVIP